jgi:hypothetical protein
MTFRVTEIVGSVVFAFSAMGAHAADVPDGREQASAQYDAAHERLKEEREAARNKCKGKHAGERMACQNAVNEKYERDLDVAKGARDKAAGDAK